MILTPRLRLESVAGTNLSGLILQKLFSQKHLTFILAILTLLLDIYPSYASKTQKKIKDFYQLSAKDIKGNLINFEKFRGKVSLVVNVATYCGFTRNHYPEMVKMYNILGNTKKFTVLAFPCNQFGQQEPDTNEEIYEFVKDIYKVDFPIFAKLEVKGDNVHPVYQYITEESKQQPTWNFWKYLVDPKGKIIQSWAPDVSMEDVFPVVEKAVKEAEAGKPTRDEM